MQPVLEVGALYGDPNTLPDYCEDDKFAKLVQQDIKDTNDNLQVPPCHMLEKLHPGTIVVVDMTLVCWNIVAARGSLRGRNVRARSLSNLRLCILTNTHHRFTKSKRTESKSYMNQMNQ